MTHACGTVCAGRKKTRFDAHFVAKRPTRSSFSYGACN
jgi:hypothetical protein